MAFWPCPFNLAGILFFYFFFLTAESAQTISAGYGPLCVESVKAKRALLWQPIQLDFC